MIVYHEKYHYAPTKVCRCLAAIKRTESAFDGRYGSTRHRLWRRIAS